MLTLKMTITINSNSNSSSRMIVAMAALCNTMIDNMDESSILRMQSIAREEGGIRCQTSSSSSIAKTISCNVCTRISIGRYFHCFGVVRALPAASFSILWLMVRMKMVRMIPMTKLRPNPPTKLLQLQLQLPIQQLVLHPLEQITIIISGKIENEACRMKNVYFWWNEFSIMIQCWPG